MNILDRIISYKRLELKQIIARTNLEQLQNRAFFRRKTHSLTTVLKTDPYGIIAEFKRASPSQNKLNLNAQVQNVGLTYATGGAAAISVLTDHHFFKGANEDISNLRPKVQIPILRKDFIFDPYQIYEAKAIGADLILLIARILSVEKIYELADLAHQLGLEVLLEVHNLSEIRTHFEPNSKIIDILGINNRNLETFEISLETALNLIEYVPATTVCIAESGIHSVRDLKMLKAAGYRGFLIGTYFMKSPNPSQTFLNFRRNLASNSL